MQNEVQVPLSEPHAKAGQSALTFLALAIKHIDALFGVNYAMKNPLLTIAMLKVMQREFNTPAPNAPPATMATSGTSPPAVAS